MNHELIAEEIVCSTVTSDVKTASPVSRQGDVVMIYVGPPHKGDHVPTPKGGCVIAAGQHGEHRLLGDSVSWDKNTVSIKGTALLVHTDVPSCRHAPIQFTEGTWRFHNSQELTVDAVIQQIRD